MKNKMNKSQLPNKIRYEYQEESNLAMQYAHGVWGGINPQGEIEINFYTEQDKIPTNSERYLKPDGSFGPEITLTEEDTRIVTRKINAKVLINRHTARALLGWLAEKLENLEAEELRNFEMEFNKNGRKQYWLKKTAINIRKTQAAMKTVSAARKKSGTARNCKN